MKTKRFSMFIFLVLCLIGILPTKTFAATTDKLVEASIVPTNLVYTGLEIKPKVKVLSEGNTLTEGLDYTLIYAEDLINVGVKEIVVKGINNNFSDLVITYEITKAENEITSFTYINGEPKATSLFGDIEYKYYSKSNLENNIDKPLRPGKYIVRAEVQDTNNYTGASKDIEFVIDDKSISNATIEGLEAKYEYTGVHIEPAFKIIVEGVTLNDNDYEIEYKNNLNVGHAEMIIKGKGHFHGTIKLAFDITKKKVIIEDFKLIDNVPTASAGNADVIFEYFTDKELTNKLDEPPKEPGKYYVRAAIRNSNIYEEYETEAIELEIKNTTTPKKEKNITGIVVVSISVSLITILCIGGAVYFTIKNKKK